MADKKDDLWAPRTNTGKYRSTDGNSVSFESYFLRDLYKQGKINDKLIRDIFNDEKILGDVEEVVKIISDPKGQNIPRGLAQAIRDLAQVVVEQN